MALTVADLVARMRVDASGVVTGTAVADKAMQQTEKQALGLGATLSTLSKGMGEFGIPFAGAVTRLESTVTGASANAGRGLTGLLAIGQKVGTGLALAFAAASVESVHLADTYEKSHAQLETSLKNIGTSAEQQSVAINHSDAAMESLGFTYAETEHSLSRLVIATGNMTEAQRASALAADVARAKGMDLASATELLVKVEAGHYTLLGRQLGISKEVIQGFHNAGDAVAYLTAKMGGQAAAYADTFAGKLAVTKARAEDLGVEFGQAIIPAVERTADAFISITHVLGEANDATEGWLGRLALIGTFGLMGMAVITRITQTIGSFISTVKTAASALSGGGAAATEGAGGAAAAAGESAGTAATSAHTAALNAQAVAAERSAVAVGENSAALTTEAGSASEAAVAMEGASVATIATVTVVGAAAIGLGVLIAHLISASSSTHDYKNDVDALTQSIQQWVNTPMDKQAVELQNIAQRARDTIAALAEFNRTPGGNGTGLSDAEANKIQKAFDGWVAIHDAIQKVIDKEGALAVAPYLKDIRTQLLALGPAGKDMLRDFSDLQAQVTAAYDAVNAHAKAAAEGIGVSTATYQQFVNMLPDGVQLSQATEIAWVRAANAAQMLGISAVGAAKDIVDGMNAATIAVIIFADNLAQATQQQVSMDSLKDSVDNLSTSMGGHGLGAAAGGGGKAVKTAAQQMVDAWSKANALYDANNKLSDSYEAVAQTIMDNKRASEDLDTATRNVTRAREDQRKASEDLLKAEQNLSNVLHGYSANSDQAKAAAITHRDAVLRVQQAQISVTQAAQNLKDVQAKQGHTTLDVQQAQLALAQAQNELTDAQTALNQSTVDLNTTLQGHAASSQEAKDAEDALQAAQRRVQDSADGVRSAIRAQEDAYIRVAASGKTLSRAQHDVQTAQEDVARATWDLQGALTPASAAMGGMAAHSKDASAQLHQVEANVVSMATTIANNTADKKKNPALWAKTFLDALTVLQNFLHPSGALAQFFDQMIAKAMILIATLQGANAATKPQPLPGGGVHIPGGPNLTARGTIAYSAQSRIFGEAGPEAAIPLGPGSLARADRQRIMAQAVQIAPDLAGYGQISGGVSSGSGMGAPGTMIYVEEVHNHMITTDREVMNKLADLRRSLGRGVTVTR